MDNRTMIRDQEKPKVKVSVTGEKSISGPRGTTIDQIVKTYRPAKNQNGFGDWIYNQCCKEEQVTLDEPQFNHIFGKIIKNDFSRVQEFCEEKGLKFDVDAPNKRYHFKLAGEGA